MLNEPASDPSTHIDPRLSGHLALDLLNTVQRTETRETDALDCPEGLRRWLVDSGLPVADGDLTASLVRQVAALREVARGLVGQRILGAPVELSRLNDYLEAGGGHWEVIRVGT